MDLQQTRRQEALVLADELLTDIELSRVDAVAIARKASRLARLLDDQEAMTWLRYEVGGYPEDGGLPTDAWQAAGRSNRRRIDDDGEEKAHTNSLGALQALVTSGIEQMRAGATRLSRGL